MLNYCNPFVYIVHISLVHGPYEKQVLYFLFISCKFRFSVGLLCTSIRLYVES